MSCACVHVRMRGGVVRGYEVNVSHTRAREREQEREQAREKEQDYAKEQESLGYFFSSFIFLIIKQICMMLWLSAGALPPDRKRPNTQQQQNKQQVTYIFIYIQVFMYIHIYMSIHIYEERLYM